MEEKIEGVVVEESAWSLFCHITLPLIVATLLVLYAIFADLSGGALQLTQRAGTVMIVVGAYVSFKDSKGTIRSIPMSSGGVNVYIDTDLWYGKWGFGYVVAGTILSGYGDLIISKLRHLGCFG
ncbi:hypothetical protein [Methylovorus mays]|uniref:hypothetical protein n=1 Tax=Methylovorus mays TaxID=184077 RepID=UPI001E60E173|nr:hypothetical protein [Methylovorus mays]MCB5206227.1 hypothetical protein [Methylovorus mays]